MTDRAKVPSAKVRAIREGAAAQYPNRPASEEEKLVAAIRRAAWTSERREVRPNRAGRLQSQVVVSCAPDVPRVGRTPRGRHHPAST